MDQKLFVRNQPGGFFAVTDREYYPSGSVFWVHAGTGTDSAGRGQNPDAPVATIDYAIGLCTASKGDTVMVMPGHAETIGGATACVLDVAGVRVKGLGWGTLKPVLTFSATDSIVSITAANCWVENLRLLANIDNTVTGISIGGSADGLVLKDLTFVDAASNKEFLICVAIATACDDLTFDGLVHNGLGGGATSFCTFAGTSDRLVMQNCRIQGTYSTSLITASAGILLNQHIVGNILHNRETGAGLCYKGNASSTGYLVENYPLGAKNNTETINTVTAMHCAENYGTDVAAASALLTPAAITAWT